MNTLAFVLAAALASAQQVVEFKADTNLQTVAVQVTDKKSHAIHGLTASDFTLLEDGHPQKIAFFGSEEEPISLVVLLDCSDSMNGSKKLARARELLSTLIRATRSQDDIAVIPFTDRIGRLEPLTPQQRQQPLNIHAPSSGNGTALYDAVATGLCNLRTSQKPRQAVVVITDGADQHSRLRLEQLIQEAQLSKPEIFMIGFWGKEESESLRHSGPKLILVNGHGIDNPLQVFARISKESGAESFFPSTERDLQDVLDHIREVVDAQYTLAYYPDHAEKTRKIQVKVRRDGVVVTAPRAVSAQRPGDGNIHFEDASCAVSATQHPYPWEPLYTTAPSGVSTYAENFSDANTGWPNRPGSKYASGAYEISHTARMETGIRTPGAPEGTIAAYGPTWRDFTATITVEENAGSAEGMVFRLDSIGCYQALVTRAGTRNASFKVTKVEWPTASSSSAAVHRETEILPWAGFTSLTGRNSVTKQMKIKVEAKADQITVWLDDVQVTRFKDSSFREGQVGVVQYGTGRSLFRSLEVSSIR